MTHPKAPGVALNISEAMIRKLVEAFYAKVRTDAVLGPVFEAKIHDWNEHLAKLSDFWSSIVLMSGRYKGRPMPVHAAIPEISDEHFRAGCSCSARRRRWCAHRRPPPCSTTERCASRNR